MRPIDADDLKKSLNNYVFNDPACPMHIAATVDQYIDFAPTVCDWIPCSERMPEPGHPVLVAYDDGEIRCMEMDADGMLWRDDVMISPARAITHWMPLPEPPGGDNNA